MLKNQYQKQVEVKHYSFEKYVSLDRWISYFYQIKEVTELSGKLSKKSLNILEIGIGNKIPTVILKQLGHKIKTLDIDPKLKPDYVSALPDLSVLKNKQFDCVLCFEVLEHIKTHDVEIALRNISKITDNAIISIPNRGITFSFIFKIWFLKIKSFYLNFPTWILKYKFNGEHYWELGSRESSEHWFNLLIKKAKFKIFKNYRIKENPYHRLYVIGK